MGRQRSRTAGRLAQGAAVRALPGLEIPPARDCGGPGEAIAREGASLAERGGGVLAKERTSRLSDEGALSQAGPLTGQPQRERSLAQHEESRVSLWSSAAYARG